MIVHLSLEYVRQRLVTFLRFIQRVLGPAIFRKFWIALFRHLNLSLRFLRSRSQWKRSIIDEQVVIPLNNIACSLYPSINEPHDGSSSSSSHTLDAAISLPSPAMLSPNCDPNTFTSSPRSSYISTSVPDDPSSPIYTTQPYFVSSPTVETRRLGHHRMCGYHSDSTESTEHFGLGEISSSRHKTLVAEPTQLTFDLSRKPSCQETLVSTPTCVDDPEPPALYHSQISAAAPENFKRHDERRNIPNQETKVTISPFCRDFSDYHDIPGWNACTHPEGGRYFHNAEKRIFTDADLYDPVCWKKITEAIRIIKDHVYQHSIQMSAKTDLALDLNEVDGEEFIDCYFADHELRVVVFVEGFPSNCLPHWDEIKGISSGTHLRQALEMQYWWHCSAYPNCIELSNDIVCELRATVMHFIMDCMTSPYANSPYTQADLQVILSNIESLKENVGMPYTGCMSFVGRLMFQFSSTKFLNFYGQPEARLNRDDSVYGDWTNRRTWFIKSISIFLFSAPDVHLRNLQKMWVDEIMHKAVWQESMKKVTDEWREFILYATVLLNANVAFLAIQSVDTNRNPYRSPTQISSYCSISASIGSIILGLILVRQNQTKHRETASDVQTFLKNRTHRWLGLETLAIMFSLPYALLMWGMVSFLIAFWFMCLQDSGIPTRSVVVGVCGVLLTLIVWCIWTSWEQQEPSNEGKHKRTNLTFEEDHAKRKPKGFKFERVNVPQQPTKRPARRRRRSTLSSLGSALIAPIKAIRRGTSKTTVEVSVDDNAKSSP